MNNSIGWISSLAIVRFDIDEGQVIEYISDSLSLNKQNQKTLSLMSFPDSNNSDDSIDNNYVFTIKVDSINYYCYVYFVQKKNQYYTRGYFQKSVVVMCRLPLIKFYLELVRVIANNLFKDVMQSQQTIDYRQVDQIINAAESWEQPMINHNYQFSLFECSFEVSIPDNHHLQFLQQNKSANNEDQNRIQNQQMNSLSNILNNVDSNDQGQYQDINLFSLLENKYQKYLYQLWEILMTNQNVLIVSDSPQICSQLVLGAISLISPLVYHGSYQPFFTVYDPDFKKVQQNPKMVKNYVMGATNPLFLKIINDTHNILYLNKEYEKQQLKSQKKEINYLQNNSTINISASEQISKLFLKGNTPEIAAINNTLIRQTFRKLTQDFLQVFHDYLNNQKTEIKSFEEKSFMEYLAKVKMFSFDSLFQKRSKIIKLYQKFVQSENFINYLKMQKIQLYFSKKTLFI